MSTDSCHLRSIGRVRRFRDGQLVWEGNNLLVDSFLEVIVLALQGGESVRGVDVGFTGGIPVTAGLRSIRGPVAFAPLSTEPQGRPFVSRDDLGARTIVTWTAVLAAAQDLTYDTLGLTAASGLLLAAIAVPETLLPGGSGETIQWTIRMRG